MFGLSSTTLLLTVTLLVLAWSFQAYWGVRTFFEAMDDVRQGSKVSEWLYARFVTPIGIGLMAVLAAFESGDANWARYGLISSVLVLWPAILIVSGIRIYELVKKTA
ncbi:hypothetical protein GCM10022407_23800 [Hymenobacter antarcticus]|uniref:SdpI/YhfL protein family protein n=1 Tax=Hymenobacter antarcticus TaxID=486270 RepID=A0ABP7Q7L2_9BACT